MTDSLEIAYRSAREWLAGLDSAPAGAPGPLEPIRTALGGPMPMHGTPPAVVIEALATHALPGLHGCAGGRFFGWVMGGSVESALAADWLASAWDQNAGMHSVSPGASIIEEIAGQWIKELLDLPREASFAFTTGCQLAHVTSMAAARGALLRRAGWDVERDGLVGAPRIRVLTSDQKHGSVLRAVRLLGLGLGSIEPLRTDEASRIEPAALQAALAAQSGPVLLVLNAADLNVAAFDRFAELIPMARAAGAWVYVDGAFGLLARASRRHRGLLEGVELADSWATDGHKWLNVPFDCGIAIVRDAAAHRAAMTFSADYLTAATDGRDALDFNPEWSRRARGIPLYAALRELGREGVEALVDRCCAHSLSLVEGIGALDGAQIIATPALNQGLLRFHRPGASAQQNDAYTDAVIRGINATGEAFFSGTLWRGQRMMRVSVVNWRTSARDVERAVEAARRVLSGSSGDEALRRQNR